MLNKASIITAGILCCFIDTLHKDCRDYTETKMTADELCLEQQQICRRYGGASKEYQEAMTNYKYAIDELKISQYWKFHRD